MSQTTAQRRQLAVRDYEHVLGILESVEAAQGLDDLKVALVDALGRELGLRHTAVFTGPTYDTLFEDSSPILAGRLGSMFTKYRSEWNVHDVFRLPEARARLERSATVSVKELRAIPAPTRDYLGQFLGGHGFYGATTLHLHHSGGHSLVGVFTDEPDLPARQGASLRLLAGHLRAFARLMPASSTIQVSGLSPRQREVAGLIAQGLTNAEIAASLVISEDTVKKHMTHILAATGCRSRTELALAMR